MSIDETKLITITSKDTLDAIIDTLESLQRDLNSDLDYSTRYARLSLIINNINVVHKEDIKSGDKIKLVCTTKFKVNSSMYSTFDDVNLVIE